MRIASSQKNRWAFVALALSGVLAAGERAHAAPTAQSEHDGDAVGTTIEEARRLAQEQRPLVVAARVIRDAVRLGPHSGYAGIVLEPQGVVLWWKGPVPKRVAAVVAEANRTIAPTRLSKAKHSRAELQAAATTLRDHFGGRAPYDAIKDPGDGSRLVLAAPLEARSPESKAFIASALPEIGVDTEVVFEDRLEPISRNDDQPPWSGGAVIVNTRGFLCTSGFGVLNGGNPAVLTAGHCGDVGDTFQDGAGAFIGRVGPKTNHDQLLIPTTATSNRIYVGSRQSNTTKLVTDWEDVFIGELLCQSGVTSAEETGSEVCGLRVLFFYMDEESLVEAEQINGETAARPGDSGGPIYSDQGSTVIAKGTTTRVAGPRIGFQDITTANQDFGGVTIPGSAPTGAVQLFQHCGFGGWVASFDTVGNVSTAQIQAAGGVNNDASSIRIAPGFRVTLYNGNNQTGTSITLTGDNSCFVGVNFNDVASSMRIERNDGGTGGVVFFQNINFGGAQSQTLARGNYTLADLVARGVPNDWASSVRIPSGFTVTLFQHDGFSGTSWTLTSDTASFLTLSPSANDQLSSVRIQ